MSERWERSCSSKLFQKVMIRASLPFRGFSTAWPMVEPSLETAPLFSATKPPMKPVSEW